MQQHNSTDQKHPLAAITPLFRDLSDAEIGAIEEATTSRLFSGQTQLMTNGQDIGVVYIIVTGSVRIRLQKEERGELILNILGPGEILGEINAVDGMGSSADVVTLETSNLLTLQRRDFCHFLKTIPLLSYNLVTVLTHRLRRITDHAEALATLDIHGRLAHQLLVFAEDYGKVGNDGSATIPIRLSQTELAGLVGATREHVNRSIAFFKTQNYISVGTDRKITIHNLQALRDRGR